MPKDLALRRFARALVALVCLVSPLSHLLSFGPEVPEGTFFLISRLGASPAALDPANLVHAFARPPVFALIGWAFSYPLAFVALGYAAHVLVHAVLFWLSLLGIRQAAPKLEPARQWLLAALLVALLFPLAHLVRLDDRGISLVPHDSFHIFSHRTLFWSTMALAVGCLSTGRRRAAIWLTALSSAVHPSAGILAFSLMIPLVGVPIARSRDRSGAVHLGLAVVAGALPMLVKKLTLELPAELTREVSWGAWYSAMIKDEADDFSFIYQLVHQPKMTALAFVAIGAVLGVYAKSVPEYRSRPAFWAALAPPLLFVVGAVTELVFCVLVPTPVTLLLIALTPGYRLLSYAFFPLVVLGAELFVLKAAGPAERLAERVPSRGRSLGLAVSLGVAITLVASVAMGAVSGRAGAMARYTGWALGAGRVDGIDEYFLGVGSESGEHFVKPRLFTVAGPFATYPGERSLLAIRRLDREQPRAVRDDTALRSLTPETFSEICRLIRARVPPGAGLVIPPYLRHFRDALVDHAVFLQEHHDGNLMMGSPAFFAFFGERMRGLMGFDYEGMPSKHSLLSFTAMRNAYLALDAEKLKRFGTEYPSYRYLVTEASHALPYRIVVRSSAFVVYDLRAAG